MKFDKLYKSIATLGFIGYLPVAPGTWGSAAGFLAIIFLKPGDLWLLLTSILLFILGVICSDNAEKILGKDNTHIIIDELCGYFVSVLFVPKETAFLAAAFFLFRFFDILKPPPIRRLEITIPGGLGIMLDDVLAGVYANICLQIYMILSKMV
ncbi:MAG: phosphatidylglycerophosphatase A [Nitrospirae bacterium]|nr:phosphatidylglycerophosphatase A [Nitrospirota bacterium]